MLVKVIHDMHDACNVVHVAHVVHVVHDMLCMVCTAFCAERGGGRRGEGGERDGAGERALCLFVFFCLRYICVLAFHTHTHTHTHTHSHTKCPTHTPDTPHCARQPAAKVPSTQPQLATPAPQLEHAPGHLPHHRCPDTAHEQR
jgi:hypothetical protein